MAKIDFTRLQRKRNSRMGRGENMIPFDQIIAGLNADAAAILQHFHGDPNTRLSSRRELRWYDDGKLRLKLDGSGKWTNFSTGEYGDVLDMIERETGRDMSAALQWARDWLRLDRNMSHDPAFQAKRDEIRRQATIDAAAEEQRRIAGALSIWEQCQ